MPRALRVLPAHQRQGRPVIDTVLLDHDQRDGQNLTVTGEKGGVFDIALAKPQRLHTDELLELEDGGLVEVVAAPEPLIEVRATSVAVLARLAWQLGDRHVPVQILPNRIRVQRATAVEALLTSVNAKPTMIAAPFDPEGGAYALSGERVQGQERDQRDHHGHAHGDHPHDH